MTILETCSNNNHWGKC